MADPKNSSPPPRTAAISSTLESRRRETLAQLESLHGTRAIGAEEYRRRAEVARRAQDETELASVSPSAREQSSVATGPRVSNAPAPLPATPEGGGVGFVFACMGGSVRKGPWEPPEILYALSLMGGIDLDFREAALLEGVTEVVILAVMGGVKITVPDDVDVEVNGIGLMGGFEHVSQHLPGMDRPLIRIKGLALMGGVSVKVKPPRGQSPVKRLANRVRDLV